MIHGRMGPTVAGRPAATRLVRAPAGIAAGEVAPTPTGSSLDRTPRAVVLPTVDDDNPDACPRAALRRAA
ncbi:hypothetical protein ACWENQ_12290 [Nonomuraea sp. NPDC004354]